MVCRCLLGEAEADRDEGQLMFMFLPASISPFPAFLSSNIFLHFIPNGKAWLLRNTLLLFILARPGLRGVSPTAAASYWMETSQDLPLYLMVSEHPSISGTPDTWLPQVSKKALLGARDVAQFIECLLAPHKVLLLLL